MVQICAVLVILAACIGYAGWRIYRALTDENEACRGCTLAEIWRKNAQRSEKIGKTFGSVEKKNYLCTRILNKVHRFTRLTVPWMSGLVYGLQNRPRRFESARHLRERKNPCSNTSGGFLFLYSSSSKRCWISSISSSSNHFESRSRALAMISGSMPVHTFFST